MAEQRGMFDADLGPRPDPTRAYRCRTCQTFLGGDKPDLDVRSTVDPRWVTVHCPTCKTRSIADVIDRRELER